MAHGNKSSAEKKNLFLSFFKVDFCIMSVKTGRQREKKNRFSFRLHNDNGKSKLLSKPFKDEI